MQVWALLLAAGEGTRFGGERPKQLLTVAGQTVLEHAIAAFERSALVDHIIVVTHADWLDWTRTLVARSASVATVVAGGATRDASVRCGLAAVPDSADRVLVHDAARPLVTGTMISDCLEALEAHGAVTVAIESVDTVVRTNPDGTRVVATWPRDELRRVQTPQGFRADVLRRAHAAAALDPHAPTDDCGLVLRHLPAESVGVVPGAESNLKIARPHDLAVAERLLVERGSAGRPAEPHGHGPAHELT